MKIRIPSPHKLRQGFSLPEVTLALGIAAFGITTILGLLPQGLSNVRKAGNVAAASQISQHILRTLDQTAADTPSEMRRYYFDAYAVPLDPTGRKKTEVAYVAEVTPPVANLALPGGQQDDNTFLQRIVVRLKQTSTVDYDFTQADPAAYNLYSHVVAKTGR